MFYFQFLLQAHRLVPIWNKAEETWVLLRVPNNSETHVAKTFDHNFRYLSIRNRYEITSQKGKLRLERAKKFLPAALSLARFARKLL